MNDFAAQEPSCKLCLGQPANAAVPLHCACSLSALHPHLHTLHRFSGKVEEWDGMCKHLVVYDDGDEEWVDLASDKIKLHAASGEA